MKFYIKKLEAINICKDRQGDGMFVIDISLTSEKALNYEKVQQLKKILIDNNYEIYISELEENKNEVLYKRQSMEID